MDRQYVLSERAHLMCPNMSFGLLLELKCAYEREKVNGVLRALSGAHPFLRSVIKFDEDGARAYYDAGAESRTEIYHRAQGDDIWEDYRQIGLKTWNVFETGLLKAYAYPGRDGFNMLFAAHHLLCDGRGLLELALEFADAYATGASPAPAPEKLIKSIQDLPPGSDLKGISRLLVKRMNKKWASERKQVSYEAYGAFSEKFCADNPVAFERRDISKDQTASVITKCRQMNTSVNDLLMAQTYINAPTDKLIIAADIRSNLSAYQPRALGNYATALSVVCKPKGEAPYELAQRVKRRVRASLQNPNKLMLVLACYLNMTPALIDAAAISALGGFESKAARFVGAAMFGFGGRDGVSITNLGAVDNPNASRALFIPPASPAMKLTLGVLTLNGEMRVCGGYYANNMKREDARRVVDSLC